VSDFDLPQRLLPHLFVSLPTNRFFISFIVCPFLTASGPSRTLSYASTTRTLSFSLSQGLSFVTPITFVLLPDFVLLDVAEAAEAFRIAERLSPNSYSMQFVAERAARRTTQPCNKLALLAGALPEYLQFGRHCIDALQLPPMRTAGI
jgi:hypothetical protein